MSEPSKKDPVLAYRPSPEPLLAQPPYLARHPEVGLLIFLVCGAIYGLISWQVLSHGPLTQWDAPLAKAIFDWAKKQPAPLVFYMRFFSAYGRDGVALIALLLTIGWVRRKARRELWMLFFGVLGGELWFQVLGNLVNRPRPSFKDPFEKLIGAGFPSGHAVTNVLLGWMALYLLWPHIQSGARRFWLTAAVIFVVVSVLFSRMFLGLHYLTDIVAGIFLGFAWGGLVYTITDLHFFRRQKVAGFHPMAMPVTGEGEGEKSERRSG
jgi:membrane-associated phospholipid phosphatase